MKLTNLRIGHRLGLGFAAVLVLMLAIVVSAWLRLERSAGALRATAALQQQARASQEWLGKTQLNLTRTLAVAKSAGQPEVEQHFGPLIKQTSAEIQKLQDLIGAQIATPEAKDLWDDVLKKRAAYLKLRDRLLELVRMADQPAVDALMGSELMPAAGRYEAAVAAVRTHQLERAGTATEQLQADIVGGERQLLVLLVAGLAVGTLMARLITRSVTLPLRAALQTTRVIAGSDLSQPVGSDRADEFGDLLREIGTMQASLRGLVGQVRESTHGIGAASGQIASGNLDLSSRTEQTSSSLQQAVASMAQLTDTVKHSAESARHASQLASSAAAVAERGGAVVSQVVETMQGINESSRRIADIVGTIDGIAFQTNILALNAAVEAARAGEQGRGFAVVATEVRHLAQRSAEAAREIKALIGASVERVEGGSRLVSHAGETMTEIVGSVQRVHEIIRSITEATAEQSDGIVQINGSVSELDRMTQQNAALVEQSRAAAGSLKAQADTLSRVVDTFRLDPAHMAG